MATGKGIINWRITVKPSEKEVRRAFRRAGRAFSDWSPAFRQMIPMIVSGTAGVLTSRGGSLGDPWPALSEMYARRKSRSRRLGRTMMVKTGKLVQSLSSSRGVLSMTNRRMVFGTKRAYARAVHFGQNRSLVGWTASMETKAIGIMSRYAQAMLDYAMSLPQAGGR